MKQESAITLAEQRAASLQCMKWASASLYIARKGANGPDRIDACVEKSYRLIEIAIALAEPQGNRSLRRRIAVARAVAEMDTGAHPTALEMRDAIHAVADRIVDAESVDFTLDDSIARHRMTADLLEDDETVERGESTAEWPFVVEIGGHRDCMQLGFRTEPEAVACVESRIRVMDADAERKETTPEEKTHADDSQRTP